MRILTIIAYDKPSAPTRHEVLPYAEASKQINTFAKMKQAFEPVGGLTWVTLQCSERGTINRYAAKPQQPKPQTKGTK